MPGRTVESAKYNVNVHDVETDLNDKRPIIAGGTGSGSASEALVRLGGEQAYQVITDYNTALFSPGSFKSATTALNSPVATHAFAGICYTNDAPPSPATSAPPNVNLVIEARDQTSTDVPGLSYVRQKKDGVWSAWVPASNTKLDLSGGTLTGDLTAPNITVTGKLDVTGAVTCGPITATGTSSFIDRCLVTGAGQPVFAVHNTTAHEAWGLWVDAAGPAIIGNVDGTGTPMGAWMFFTAGAGMTNNQDALKPGGGPWTAVSDARIKTVLSEYQSGLREIRALRPVIYSYNANDVMTGTRPKPSDPVIQKGDPDPRSPHYALRNRKFIGLVAQDAEVAMPEIVNKVTGVIDDKAVSDLRQLDTGPLLFALVNAIRELAGRIEALEAK